MICTSASDNRGMNILYFKLAFIFVLQKQVETEAEQETRSHSDKD